jgi:hypothetical protein
MQTAKSTFDAMSKAGLSAFFNIANLWKLSADEEMILLGSPARSTFYQWKKDPASAKLKRNTLERLSYLVGIYADLEVLFAEPERPASWIRRRNDAVIFNGQSALEKMLHGNIEDLSTVRQYLDSIRGGQ